MFFNKGEQEQGYQQITNYLNMQQSASDYRRCASQLADLAMSLASEVYKYAGTKIESDTYEKIQKIYERIQRNDRF